ncbi:hypothetical protein [Streptomyces sp. CB03911]|uniref:hypothetical protein n=1 Tax=Streptomycetaceae TaxID=2062 RepID=UPI00093B570B|nr:hypothetical protein [Streptomyces sp. CB03911]OKI22718.1 hypothetical protein A6A07_34165 [Streptomyces sp. CB03911]
MSRTSVRLAATAATAVLAVTGLSGAAAADTTPAPASGSVVVHESTSFIQQTAAAGVVVVPLPAGQPGYDSATGFSATFPATGGDANLQAYYDKIDLGGGLLFVNLLTGKTAIFKQLAFQADTWKLTGVPLGATAPVNLLDPAGDNQITRTGTTQSLEASDLKVDAQGAQYVDGKLGTTFFQGGQSVGSLSITFTPAG